MTRYPSRLKSRQQIYRCTWAAFWRSSMSQLNRGNANSLEKRIIFAGKTNHSTRGRGLRTRVLVFCKLLFDNDLRRQQWRRRELNPRPPATQLILQQAVAKISKP